MRSRAYWGKNNLAAKRGDKWQGRVTYEGRSVRPSFDTKELAEAWEAASRLCISQNLPIPSAHTITTGGVVGGFFPVAAEYIWGEKKSYLNMLGHMRDAIDYFTPQRSVASIDGASIIQWVTKLRASNLQPATINHKVGCLFGILKHAKDMGLISVLPARPHQKVSNGRLWFLSQVDEDKMLAAFKHLGMELEYHATRFALSTGCRIGEILRRARSGGVRQRYVVHSRTLGVPIEWPDISAPYGTADRVMVDGVSRAKVTFWETKDGLWRAIPLPAPAAEALEFSKSQGLASPFEGLNYTMYYRSFQQVREAVGETDNPNYVPHILRHTCASRFAQSGWDALRIKEWLGHKNITTTQRYMHLAPTDLFEMVDAPDEPARPSLRIVS
jgi:integrase